MELHKAVGSKQAALRKLLHLLLLYHCGLCGTG
jgi:hypothetical protein